MVLILEGDKLQCDQLQFGYQAKTSTAMCTWAATAVIEYYNRAGAPVYGCTADMSKAFDMVNWSVLFNELKERNIAPIFLRVILYIYSEQYCDVRWNGSYSHRFPICNGVRQGAISSPIFWCIYCNSLILKLRQSNIGCTLCGEYCGVFIYADDILILSASRPGLQAMVDICNTFAVSRNLKFSTNIDPVRSKTKCILFSKRAVNMVADIAPILLGGVPLPWVTKVSHLGHTLQCDNSMTMDCDIKRGQFIGRVHSLLQEFYFSPPDLIMKLINIYATSFYGSNCYNLFSSTCNRMYRAWNVAVRMTFKLDRTCHRYLIESISNCLHPQVLMSSRFVKFHENNLKCNKSVIRSISSLFKDDLNTVYGSNLGRIAQLCNTNIANLNPQLVKTNMRYFELPENESWRLPVIFDLLQARNNMTEIAGFDIQEVEDLLRFTCTS